MHNRPRTPLPFVLAAPPVAAILFFAVIAPAQTPIGPDFTLTAQPMSSNSSGSCTAGGKDVNGDGVPDVIVGAANHPGPTGTSSPKPGAVYVFSGATHGLLGIAYGANDGDRFGWSVDLIDDCNGDGCADILVGAPGFDPAAGRADAGAFYLVSGLTRQVLHRLDGNLAGDQFGFCVANTRDIDGNGWQDFVVGSPYGDVNGQVDCGQVHFFNVLPGGGNSSILLWGAGNAAGDHFGWKVAAVGDVNGDGFRDWAASSPGEDFPTADCGQIHVYFGPLGGGFATHVSGQTAGARLGESFAFADVNGDGRNEVVVGAPGHLGGRGRICVLAGAQLTELFGYGEVGLSTSSSLGLQVGAVGDSNGDGIDDFAYTEGPANGSGPSNSQTVCVVGGSGSGPFPSSCRLFRISNFTTQSGFYPVRNITNCGDIDGDGLTEMLVGWNEGSSVFSNPALVAPAQVGSATASDTLCDRVRVTWPAVPGTVQYRILRNGAVLGTSNGTPREFVDSNPGTASSSYSVQAFVGPNIGAPSPSDVGSAFACFQTYGTPCLGTAGVPTLSRIHDPEIATVFQQRVNNLAPGSIAGWFLGLSRTSYAGVNLPLALSPLGFGSCTLLVSVDISAAGLVAGNGTHTFQLSLANDAGLLGLHFYTQAFGLDPQANTGGIVFSGAADNVVSSPW